MKISIVVPAYNEEKLIGATLARIGESAVAFTRAGMETELIVCNNNSTDRTGELAAAAGARVVFEPVNQIGRARNTGAAAATGDWLLFIDADSHPSPALLADVAAAVQSGRYLAGGATLRLDGEGGYWAARMVVRVWNQMSRVVKIMAGSFIFCETAAFREIGGFDLRLYASEEIDLSQRLKKVARRRNRRLIMLHRHPLLTSARKLHLYGTREHLRFLARTFWARGGTLRNPKDCNIWYDGRR